MTNSKAKKQKAPGTGADFETNTSGNHTLRIVENQEVSVTIGSEPITVSYVEYASPCSKEFNYVDGQWGKKPLYRSNNAVTRAITFDSFDAYVDDRLSRDAKSVQVMGAFQSEYDGLPCLTRKRALTGDVTATNEFIRFRNGVAGVMVIDIDIKQSSEVVALYPEQPDSWASPAECLSALHLAVPELANHPSLCMDSTSARLHVEGVHRIDGNGGFHLLIPVADAAEIVQLGQRIFGRFLAGGLGWGFVSSNGQIQIRTPFDLALARSPAQANFCAPEFIAPIQQDRRHILKSEGSFLRLQDIAWDGKNLADANVARNEIKSSLGEISRTTIAASRKKIATELAKNPELTNKQIDKIIRSLEGGILTAALSVAFKDKSSHTVLELLSGIGADLDGSECANPLNPNYDNGRFCSKFFSFRY